MQDKNPVIPHTEPPPHPTDAKVGVPNISEKVRDNSPAEVNPRKHYQVEEVKEPLSDSSGVADSQQGDVGLQVNISQSNSPMAAMSPEPSQSIKTDSSNLPPGTMPFIPHKKRIKPLIILIIVALLGLLLFVAFRLRSSGPILLGKKGEILWWGIQHDESVYKPLIEEFERQHPNVKVVYQKQSTKDYRERLTNALAAGRGPDIFEIHSTWPYMFKNDLASLPASVMSQEEYTQSFYPVIVSNLSLQQGIVAIPLEYDALTLFINEDIFATAIQKPPETWNELKDLVDGSKKGSLTIRQGGKIIQSGVALGDTVNIDHWPEIIGLMMFQNRANPARLSTESESQVLSFYNQFKRMGVWNNTLPASTIAFSRGNVAMYFGPTSRARDIAAENSNLKFRTVKLPQLPKDKPTDPDYSYATYWAQGVWERSQNKETAWEFLKYLTERDSLEKLNDSLRETEGYPRAFPRPEMNIQFRDDLVVGSVVALALDAKSWYLADNTFDGPTGINSQLKSAYEETLKTWGGGIAQLKTLSQAVQEILLKYSIPLR